MKFPSGLVVGFAGSLATSNILARPDGDFVKLLKKLDSDADVNKAFDFLQGVANFQLKGAGDTQFWALVLLAMGPTLVCMGNAAGWHRVQDFRCIAPRQRRYRRRRASPRALPAVAAAAPGA